MAPSLTTTQDSVLVAVPSHQSRPSLTTVLTVAWMYVRPSLSSLHQIKPGNASFNVPVRLLCLETTRRDLAYISVQAELLILTRTVQREDAWMYVLVAHTTRIALGLARAPVSVDLQIPSPNTV